MARKDGGTFPRLNLRRMPDGASAIDPAAAVEKEQLGANVDTPSGGAGMKRIVLTVFYQHCPGSLDTDFSPDLPPNIPRLYLARTEPPLPPPVRLRNTDGWQ